MILVIDKISFVTYFVSDEQLTFKQLTKVSKLVSLFSIKSYKISKEQF